MQPFLLIGTDHRIIEDQLIVVDIFELGEAVAVLGYTDAVDSACLGAVEESLYPSKIVRTVFEMHMIIKFHDKNSFITDNTSIIRSKRKLGYWYRTKRKIF